MPRCIASRGRKPPRSSVVRQASENGRGSIRRKRLRWIIRQTRRTRADCDKIERPCKHRRCRYHLGMNYWQDADGFVHVERVKLPPGAPTCALDVAEAAMDEGFTREQVAEILGYERWQVQEIEERAIRLVKRKMK